MPAAGRDGNNKLFTKHSISHAAASCVLNLDSRRNRNVFGQHSCCCDDWRGQARLTESVRPSDLPQEQPSSKAFDFDFNGTVNHVHQLLKPNHFPSGWSIGAFRGPSGSVPERFCCFLQLTSHSPPRITHHQPTDHNYGPGPYGP